MTRSAVDFPTKARVHMGLAVTDLEASRRFYELLLSMPPTKPEKARKSPSRRVDWATHYRRQRSQSRI